MGVISRSTGVIGVVAMVLLTLMILPSSAPAGAQLVSSRNPAVPQPVPGNGSSAGPIISPDGRYVVFVSTANDLVAGDNDLLTGDVFVRDRQSNTTTLVSANINGTGGGNGNSLADAISPDGRYVLFESFASNLTALNDTNGASDVFVRDLVMGTTTLVSVSTNGIAGNAAASAATMTPDGRFVAFVSYASNLAPNYNGIAGVYVRDLGSGTTTKASIGATIAAGSQPVMDSPVITPDGRFVAFYSTARIPSVNGTETPPFADIYCSDLQSGTITWISTNNSGQNLPATHPSISDDGRFVSFKQMVTASNASVYRYDAVAGSNTLVVYTAGQSLGLNGSSFVDDLTGPEMTPDGRFIFYSTGNVLVQWDGLTSTATAVNLDAAGLVPAVSSKTYAPVLTPDGRYLAFLCNATNMVTNVISNSFHLYLRDLQLATNYLVDVDGSGTGLPDVAGVVPSISANGNLVAFASLDAGFLNGDNNLAQDVFLRDMTNGTTGLISARNPAIVSSTGNGISAASPSSVTPDGHWLVFTSISDDLLTNDFNKEQDVFVRNLVTGSNVLVSVGIDGNAALGGWSGFPAISADGRYIAFLSVATNLIANDTNNSADVYLRDLQSNSTIRVNVESNGVLLLDSSLSAAPMMSQDGRFVAFTARTNVSTPYNTFVRDTLTGQTAKLPVTSGAQPPTISSSGRYIAYSDGNTHWHVWDTVTASNIYDSLAFVLTGAVNLSPDGSKLLYAATGQLVAVDVVGKTNIFSFASSSPIRSSQWSGDSRYFAFVSSTAATPVDSNNLDDVFLYNLQNKTVTLVSHNSSQNGAGNAASDAPAVSGDGRFVVFRSFATNLVPGTSSPPNLFMFDRLTGSNALITLELSTLPNWNPFVSRPAISGDGGFVAFQSVKSHLVPGVEDSNRLPDLFFAPLSPLSFGDDDGDGIPDWWLNQYFGHPDGQAGDYSRAQDDSDGDGMSNLQEYLTGTIPTNNSSVFRLQITPTVASTNVTLNWPSVPGKNYRVQYKDHLQDPSWVDLSGNIFVAGAQVSFTAPANVPSRYYRVVTVN